MKMIGLLVLVIGFIPAFYTASGTDGYFRFIDYMSVLCGFGVCCVLMEMDNAKSRN